MIRVWEKVNNINFDNVTLNNNQMDAFGRLRISETNTLLDITNTIGKNELVIDELVTSAVDASSVHCSFNSCVTMSVTGNGDRVIRQSRRYCVYQPGKSLLIEATGVLDYSTNAVNCDSRIGYFDSSSGFFFQYKDTSLNLVKRSYSSGSVVDTIVNQAAWNLNTLTADTSSSYIFNPAKSQIFLFDFQWLGVGRVRCGVVHEGKIYYVHQFVHDNITTSTYTTNMNLPIRYEIISTGGHGQLQQICGTAISEGGYNPVGLTFSASNNTTYKTVGTTEIPLVSIRLKSDRNRTNVIPGDFNVLTETNSNIIYFIRLYRAPSSSPLTGAIWNSANVNSAIEYDVSATALDTTGSILVSQGYSSGKTSKQLSGDLTLAFSGYNQLTANINGVSDYFVISAKRFSGGSDINTVASLEWREIF